MKGHYRWKIQLWEWKRRTGDHCHSKGPRSKTRKRERERERERAKSWNETQGETAATFTHSYSGNGSSTRGNHNQQHCHGREWITQWDTHTDTGQKSHTYTTARITEASWHRAHGEKETAQSEIQNKAENGSEQRQWHPHAKSLCVRPCPSYAIYS